ncbi:MAG: RagB/SusD family nutrient uptake outer membrane protein, partial [Bacteroidales bacterium]|nr:RagB/SusD family nutrient uptake outer membrane protein [Bacteroidales bacterium]
LDLFKADKSEELMWYFKGDLSQKVGIGVLLSNLGRVMIRQVSGGAANHSPSVQLACAYTCIDGLPIDESPLYNPKDPFENRDPRMKMTIQPFKTAYSKDLAEYEQSKKDGTFPQKYPEYINHGYEYNPSPYAITVYRVSDGKMVNNTDSKARNQHSAYNGLMLKKYVKDSWIANWTTTKIADNVYPYLRYAEILMTYIEAKNEMGTVTQADLDKSINKVRERAYKGSGIEYPKVTVDSQAALRKIIRMERRVEFAWENDRYNCLRRWGIMEKTHNIPMYYLNRSWSGGADWNGLVEGSNRTLSADFLKHLKNWDDGNYPFGGIPKIDENGIPDVKYMEDAGYIVPFYQMHFEAPKNYLWPIPANDILVNPNLSQNPGW